MNNRCLCFENIYANTTNLQPTHFSAQLVLPLSMKLGEGPLWDFHRQLLFFVDISARQLHYYDPRRQHHGYHQFHQMPTALGLQTNQSLLIALEHAVAQFVPEAGTLTPYQELDIDAQQLRTNDAKVGPDGCFYLGTMDRKKQNPVANLWRVAPHGEATSLLSHQTIANGMAWSPDQQTMYFIDSPTRKVQAYDFNRATGTMERPRTLVETAEDEGIPDGMTVDVEGHLWVAHNGGGFVARYHHSTGELLAKVNVPAPLVTCCAFGGHNYQTLYITTACEGLDEEQRQHHPQSGGLFAVQPPWYGQPTFSFGE